MKERFSEGEWALLKTIPLQVFGLVAGADGKVDKKEVRKLTHELGDALRYKDELHRELFSDILHDDVGKLIDRSRDVSVDALKETLHRHLAPAEYQGFLASMIGFGLEIARASGGGLLGIGDPICAEEKLAIATFAAAFDLDLAHLQGRG